MCSFALASIAFSAIGTISSVVGSIQQGQQARNQANFQAQVARNNAIIAERQAEDARRRGLIAAGEKDLETRQRIGRQRVVLAGSGQEVDIGSGLEITSDTAALGKLDSLRIINNAEREAAGFDIQSQNFLSEASIQEVTGRNAITSSSVQAFGTLVTGAGSVAGKWSALKKSEEN